MQGPSFESHADLDRRDWVAYLLVLATCRLPVSFGPSRGDRPQIFDPHGQKIVSKSGLEPFFQFFDIVWSTLDIMDDFKPISKKVYLFFGEIKRS